MLILTGSVLYAGVTMSKLAVSIAALAGAVTAALADRDKARAELESANQKIAAQDQDLAALREQLAVAEADALTTTDVDTLNTLGQVLGLPAVQADGALVSGATA